jgi:hypothetical protein
MITRVRALFSMNVFPDLFAVAILNPVTMGSSQREEAARHCVDLPKL